MNEDKYRMYLDWAYEKGIKPLSKKHYDAMHKESGRAKEEEKKFNEEIYPSWVKTSKENREQRRLETAKHNKMFEESKNGLTAEEYEDYLEALLTDGKYANFDKDDVAYLFNNAYLHKYTKLSILGAVSSTKNKKKIKVLQGIL